MNGVASAIVSLLPRKELMREGGGVPFVYLWRCL